MLQEFKDRLRTRPTRPDMEIVRSLRGRILEMCLKISEKHRLPDFSMTDLLKSMSNLKNNNSKDPQGLVNEIFKEGCVGTDLRESLLKMFNTMKHHRIFPLFMRLSNITPIHKKDSKMILKNFRGISRVSVIRSLYMRMLYNQKYEEIDSTLPDSQMGGRKNKGCRNNLFIINGIIFDINRNKNNNSKSARLQIVDIEQMFDGIHLEQALIDLFMDSEIQDETISILPITKYPLQRICQKFDKLSSDLSSLRFYSLDRKDF